MAASATSPSSTTPSASTTTPPSPADPAGQGSAATVKGPVLPSPSMPHVLALSARDARSLTALSERLADRLAQAPDTDLDDVALTLDTGRERFPCRRAVVGEDLAALVRRLREPLSAAAGAPAPRTDRTSAGVVLLLDGSGIDGLPAELPGATGLPLPSDDIARHAEDAPAARAVATLYSAGRWLLDRRLTPVAVRGEDRIGALAAAALRGSVSPADALRTAAAGPCAPTAEDPPSPRDAVVVRIGRAAQRGATPESEEALTFDPADGASAARLLARLWCLGLDVDTTLGRPGRRLRLPGHPMWRRTSGEHRTQDTGRPLTPYEQRLLFYDLVRRGTSGDHAVVCARAVAGAVPEQAALATAFAELQRRHPALRTVFGERGGRWRATVLPRPQADPDLLPADPAGVPERLTQAVRASAARPFVLRDAPLVHCCVQEGPTHWALALAVYEPLTASVAPEDLTAELLGLLEEMAPSTGAALTRPS
ncbi:CurL C-terminal domain-containing protein [Streptomyces sp. NPDC001139]